MKTLKPFGKQFTNGQVKIDTRCGSSPKGRHRKGLCRAEQCYIVRLSDVHVAALVTGRKTWRNACQWLCSRCAKTEKLELISMFSLALLCAKLFDICSSLFRLFDCRAENWDAQPWPLTHAHANGPTVKG